MKTNAIICVAVILLCFSCAKAWANPPFSKITRSISATQRAVINANKTNSLKTIERQALEAQRAINAEKDVAKVKQQADAYVKQAQAQLAEAAKREAELKEKETRLVNSERSLSWTTILSSVTAITGLVTTFRAWKSNKLDNRMKELEIAKLEAELAQLKAMRA